MSNAVAPTPPRIGPAPAAAAPRAAAQAGFTMIELLISLLLLVELIVAVLVLFDFNNRLTRVQTHVADMQQSLRISQDEIVRYVRMAGRGGLPDAHNTEPIPGVLTGWHYLPTGISVEVTDNAADDATIGDDPDTPDVVEFSDVLTVRGVFNTPLYQVGYTDTGNFVLNNADPAAATGGTILVTNFSPTGNIPQDLQPLADAINDEVPEALLLMSPLSDDIYAVVQLDPANSVINGAPPTSISVAFIKPDESGGVPNPQSTHDGDYLNLSPGKSYPVALTNVSTFGILEEHRYYVREEWNDPEETELASRLSRARVFPGTQVPYRDDTDNWEIDIADNIVDLQNALGVDLDGDGAVAEAAVDGSDDDFKNDEWLGNHWEDDRDEDRWKAAGARLFYVRVNVLARTDRRDPGYVSPPILKIEDSEYAEEPAPDTEANRLDRLFRRRVLQTTVDLRNL